ncbi:MAG: hypothetical protein LBM92_06690, partial [Opitutaceae bacterium]|nr:hypothetical protein [Opitutaceae bacterium]
MKQGQFYVLGLFAAVLLLFPACATHIRISNKTNPPPGEAFSNFTAFEIKPVTLAPRYANNDTNKKALVKIQENLSLVMDPTITNWNHIGATKGTPQRTLVITPVVSEIKFIGGAARFWVGPVAGSSAVILRVAIVEKETGKTIATPEFYSSAGSWNGSWTVGGTDNAMLGRTATKVSDYLIKNYATPVGGPTGAKYTESCACGRADNAPPARPCQPRRGACATRRMCAA